MARCEELITTGVGKIRAISISKIRNTIAIR